MKQAVEQMFASFAPQDFTGDAELVMERYDSEPMHARGTIRFLAAQPDVAMLRAGSPDSVATLEKSVVVATLSH